MINSIFTKFAALMLVFALILVPAMLFLSSDAVQSAHAQPEHVAQLKITEPLIEKEPVIQAASLSIMEDTFRSTLTNTDTAGLMAQAHELVSAQKFDQAIHVLNAVQGEDKNRYDVQFLFARVLSWSGQHDAAEDKFQVLTQSYPQNADVLVSHGYLKLYQNKHAQAERIFKGVLETHPNYEDAQSGLSKAQLVKG